MKIFAILFVSVPLFAQSNAIQLCDQQAIQHCIQIQAPDLLTFNPAPILFSGNSGALLVGMATTDLSVLPGSIVSADAFVSASATSNASIISMAATPSTGGADISVGKTGTGTLLPMRFYRNPNEVFRIHTTNQVLFGMTTTDISSGLGSVIASDIVASASASVNASILSIAAKNTGAFISSGASGTGTVQPIIFFRNPTEVMRIDTLNHLLVGITTDNGSGASIQAGSHITAAGTMEAEKFRVIVGTPSAVTDYFDWEAATHILDLKDSSSNVILAVDRTVNKAFIFDGNLWPNVNNSYSSGTPGLQWINTYTNNLTVNGVNRIDSSGFGTFQSVNSALNVSVNTATSGAVVLGSSEWQPTTTNTVSLGDASHTFANGYFQGLQAVGSLVGGTVLGNSIIGISSFSSSIGNFTFGSGTTIVPPSGFAALNGSFSCSAGQHISTFTASQGLLTGFGCS